ncbi:MAG TPA: hypothetical protein V6C81_12655 [Planktothrix sp.]|jgi:hypothetical protein
MTSILSSGYFWLNSILRRYFGRYEKYVILPVEVKTAARIARTCSATVADFGIIYGAKISNFFSAGELKVKKAIKERQSANLRRGFLRLPIESFEHWG